MHAPCCSREARVAAPGVRPTYRLPRQSQAPRLAAATGSPPSLSEADAPAPASRLGARAAAVLRPPADIGGYALVGSAGLAGHAARRLRRLLRRDFQVLFAEEPDEDALGPVIPADAGHHGDLGLRARRRAGRVRGGRGRRRAAGAALGLHGAGQAGAGGPALTGRGGRAGAAGRPGPGGAAGAAGGGADAAGLPRPGCRAPGGLRARADGLRAARSVRAGGPADRLAGPGWRSRAGRLPAGLPAAGWRLGRPVSRRAGRGAGRAGRSAGRPGPHREPGPHR